MLDTDTASYIIRGRSETVAARLSEVSPSNVCISVVTRAELRYGLKSLPPDHRLHHAVERFLAVIRALPWSAVAADRYADVRYYLVTTGQPIGEMDMMIAAHAVAEEATLVTNNTRHFERVPNGPTLANWSN